MKKKLLSIFCFALVAGFSVAGAACDFGKTPGDESGGIVVEFPQETLQLETWKSYTLNATASDNSTIVYTVSDPTVLYLDGNTITAIKAGTATVTATSGGKTDVLEVTVTASEANAPLLAISGKDSLTVLERTTSYMVALKHGTSMMNSLLPGAASFAFSVSDTDVATIDAKTGTLTVVKSGTVTVTVKATYCGAEFVASKTLTISDVYELTATDSLSFSYDSDSVASKKIEATLLKNGAATTETVSYESEDPSVATVDAEGNVTVLKVGKTTITVSATVNGKVYEKEVSISCAKPTTVVESGVTMKFWIESDVEEATFDIGELNIEDLNLSNVSGIQCDGVTIATLDGNVVTLDKAWLATRANGVYEAIIDLPYYTYIFELSLKYHFQKTGLYTHVKIEETAKEMVEIESVGTVYEIAEGAAITFSDPAAIDAKYAEGYTWLSFEIMFPDAVPGDIIGNLGGAQIEFHNDHYTFSNGRYITPHAASVNGDMNWTPKNYIDKETEQVAFLIYDAEGEVVCDIGNDPTQQQGSYEYITGGEKDGRIEVGAWYKVVIALVNRNETFAKAGLSLSGIGKSYIKSFKLSDDNPYKKVGVDVEGAIYENIYSEKKPNGIANYTDETGFQYTVDRRPIEPDENGVYDLSKNITQTPITNELSGEYVTNFTNWSIGWSNHSAAKNEWGTYCGAQWFTFDDKREISGANYLSFTVNFDAFANFTVGGIYGREVYPTANDVPLDLLFLVGVQWWAFELNTGAKECFGWTGISVYDAETDALIYNGGATAGEALVTGKNYVFEIDLSVMNYANGTVSLLGLQNSKVSNIRWTDRSIYDTSPAPAAAVSIDLPSAINDYKKTMLSEWTEIELEQNGIAMNTNLQSDGLFLSVGLAEDMNKAYAAGYTNSVVSLVYTEIANVVDQMTAGGRHVYFNASTGEITTGSWQNVEDAKAAFKIYDSKGNPVFGALTANEQYYFVFDLNKKELPDFNSETITFRAGMNNVLYAGAYLVDDAWCDYFFKTGSYTVNHYVGSADAEDNQLILSETLYAHKGKEVTVNAFEKVGFAVLEGYASQTVTVLEDNSLVVNVYYSILDKIETSVYYWDTATNGYVAETKADDGSIKINVARNEDMGNNQLQLSYASEANACYAMGYTYMVAEMRWNVVDDVNNKFSISDLHINFNASTGVITGGDWQWAYYSNDALRVYDKEFNALTGAIVAGEKYYLVFNMDYCEVAFPRFSYSTIDIIAGFTDTDVLGAYFANAEWLVANVKGEAKTEAAKLHYWDTTAGAYVEEKPVDGAVKIDVKKSEGVGNDQLQLGLGEEATAMFAKGYTYMVAKMRWNVVDDVNNKFTISDLHINFNASTGVITGGDWQKAFYNPSAMKVYDENFNLVTGGLTEGATYYFVFNTNFYEANEGHFARFQYSVIDFMAGFTDVDLLDACYANEAALLEMIAGV